MTSRTDTSRIIRADRRGPALIRAELYDAQLTAAAVRSAAQTEAAQLRAASQAERERLRAECEAELARERESARAEGYAAGYAEGSAHAARELASIAAARGGVLRDAESQLKRAALQIAGKLLGRAIEHDPAFVGSLVEPLLARVRRAQRVVLCLHPKDADALEPQLAAIRTRAELQGTLQVVRDEAVARGGCTVESELGELDARVSTRLDEIARALGWDRP